MAVGHGEGGGVVRTTFDMPVKSVMSAMVTVRVPEDGLSPEKERLPWFPHKHKEPPEP